MVHAADPASPFMPGSQARIAPIQAREPGITNAAFRGSAVWPECELLHTANTRRICDIRPRCTRLTQSISKRCRPRGTLCTYFRRRLILIKVAGAAFACIYAHGTRQRIQVGRTLGTNGVIGLRHILHFQIVQQGMEARGTCAIRHLCKFAFQTLRLVCKRCKGYNVCKRLAPVFLVCHSVFALRA